MTEDELETLITRLRRAGLEPSDIEVKADVGGFPSTVANTLCAFANGSGGTLILGITEEKDFTPAPNFNPAPIRDALADACSSKVTPPIRDEISVLEFEGSRVVCIEVSEFTPDMKPCYISSRGMYNGSLIRSGDGERHLTHFEVNQLNSNTTPAVHDNEVVDAATLSDFDDELSNALVSQARESTPRAFKNRSDEDVLVRLGAAAIHDGQAKPTIAGLLALGEYPQQYFPQLFTSFVVYPTKNKGESGSRGERFLDNRSFDGPIPLQVSAFADAMKKHMSKSTVIRGFEREDRYDFPLEALREVFVNALLHRDYSPESRGAQIQVELYPDRIEILSPGGLFGNIYPEQLGTEDITSSSRNGTLAKLLSDLPLPNSHHTIVENRGTGLIHVSEALRSFGMPPAQYKVSPGQLRVRMDNSTLLSPDTLDWIASLGLEASSNTHHLALAMMRNTGTASTGMLSAWGVPREEAGAVFRHLTSTGVAIKRGVVDMRLTISPATIHRSVSPTSMPMKPEPRLRILDYQHALAPEFKRKPSYKRSTQGKPRCLPYTSHLVSAPARSDAG